jgi:hypothetical protein
MDIVEERVEQRLSELTHRVRTSTCNEPRLGAAVVSGAAGALALTAVHQLARRSVPYAPRMDVLGMRAIARGAHRVGRRPPTGRVLYRATLAGDLLSNTAYYSVVALGGRHALRAGAALGIAAGAGALVLPPLLGLGNAPHAHAWPNRLMTVAWYTLGGLVAGAVYERLHARGRAVQQW